MKFLKPFIYKLLCNSISGTIIRAVFRKNIPDIRWPRYRFHVPGHSVNKTILASIFWGFYESSEIRFIEKYLEGNNDVIELGSSLGIVSSHIAAKLKPGKRLLLVEANPYLSETINNNISRFMTADTEYKVINKAIGYNSTSANLHISNNNTETHISDQEGHQVAVCKLSDIISQEGISDYTLVCDIEGSEAGVLESDKSSLRHCRQLFIELHDTEYNGRKYSIESFLSILTGELGFNVRAHQGPVFLLER